MEFNLVLIRNRRIELNLSQQELAIALGFKDASTYLKYERGEYAFKAKQLPILAEILQCKVTDFFVRNVA
ncbi:helix-turn-helix domain-containing protein [Bacillus pumilus]|uniref:XRE family transcriptional regulator n=1 Tax=Bacillus pumilus TaxID=1408 RepID=A0AAD0MKR9_BACPU|nr:helix-turn-helix transcriptional regulator [Bacillus pumilus]AVM23233.1 XRE family transcriptional regulator [Bacillus pumilus]TYS44599.1 helix-turn-helix transcriptional regulator [Bacillus pumilus]